VGTRALGRNSTLFAVILNVFLSRNLDHSKLKNAYFLRKKLKIAGGKRFQPPFASGSWGRVVTLAYYYNSVEFVFSAKCVLFCSEKETSNISKVLPLLLSHLYIYFLIQTL